MNFPKKGTKTYKLVDEWLRRGGNFYFMDAVNFYTGRPNPFFKESRAIHMTVWRILKRFGKKSGPSGSRGPWLLNDDVAIEMSRQAFINEGGHPDNWGFVFYPKYVKEKTQDLIENQQA